ncbi:hypothetical protein BDQ17DRAFT_1358739 [Cyathus striatus]|nr:hypothetical protein BDQ17DRAFT_1358739 [Cyathus striatus]
MWTSSCRYQYTKRAHSQGMVSQTAILFILTVSPLSCTTVSPIWSACLKSPHQVPSSLLHPAFSPPSHRQHAIPISTSTPLHHHSHLCRRGASHHVFQPPSSLLSLPLRQDDAMPLTRTVLMRHHQAPRLPSSSALRQRRRSSFFAMPSTPSQPSPPPPPPPFTLSISNTPPTSPSPAISHHSISTAGMHPHILTSFNPVSLLCITITTSVTFTTSSIPSLSRLSYP